MKLKMKIIVGYILFAIIIGIVGLIGTMGARDIEKNFREISEDVLPTVKALENLRFAGLRIVSSVSEHGLLMNYAGSKPSRDSEALATEKSLIDEGKELFRKSLESYERQVIYEPDEKVRLEEIREYGEALITDANKLIEMMATVKSPESIMEMKEHFELAEKTYLDVVNSALVNEYDELAREKQKASKALSSTVKTIGIVTFFTVIIGLLAGWLLASAIVRPLKWLQESVYRIRNGDFDVPIVIGSKDEVGELAADFELMRVEVRTARESLILTKVELEHRTSLLEQANSELESFSYSVSHDLRSPLQRIYGFCQLLEEESADRLDSANSGYLKMISAAAMQMSQLIDNLLDFSLMSRKELCCQQTDLSAVVQVIAAELQMSDLQRKAEFRIMAGITAFGDPPLLHVVLTNLMGNAWKYTSRKDIAIIEFRMDLVAGTPVYSVRDNGEGFDMAAADELFTPFKRLHKKDDFEGTGIGLATVHRIVTRHFGKIWAESEAGKGAAFYFTLQDTPEGAQEAALFHRQAEASS